MIDNNNALNVFLKKNLSPREVEVSKEVLSGASNKYIGDKLFVTEKTIKFHMTNIYKKLGIKSRAQFFAKCLPFIADSNNKKEETEDLPSLNYDYGHRGIKK